MLAQRDGTEGPGGTPGEKEAIVSMRTAAAPMGRKPCGPVQPHPRGHAETIYAVRTMKLNVSEKKKKVPV